MEVKTAKHHLLLKICSLEKFDKPRVKNDILYCLEYMEFLRKNSIPTPRLFRTKENEIVINIKLKGKKHFASLASFIEGKTISRYNKEVIEQTAKIQARMHKLAENYEPKRKSTLNEYFNYTKWFQECRDSLDRKSRQRKVMKDLEKIIGKSLSALDHRARNLEHQILIHGDINNENLLFKDHKIVGILDFGDCHRGSSAEDIGIFLSSCLSGQKARQMKQRSEYYFKSYNNSNQKLILQSLHHCILKWALTQYYFNTNDLLEGRSLDTKENMKHNSTTLKDIENLSYAISC